MSFLLSVLVPTPAHSQLSGPLSYRSAFDLPPGSLVRVPLGRRETLGVVWDRPGTEQGLASDPEKLRDIASALTGLPALTPNWRRLVAFAAAYYQRSPGEVALAALPPQLRELSEQQLQRRLKRPLARTELAQGSASEAPALSVEQQAAIDGFGRCAGTSLLFGATGSGKTEVYLHCVQELLLRDAQAQALVMVPEINLTPQLEKRFVERFGPVFGAQSVVAMHSGMGHPQRLRSWLFRAK